MCPPFLPDFSTVRFIHEMRISERKFEFPKFPFDIFRREFIIEHPVVIVLNNNATLAEEEIVFWAFGIVRCRAGYCVTLGTTYDEDDATHKKWRMENRKESRLGATLASSSLKDSFRGLSPEIYRDFS
jgi:hypothetical protein